MIKVNNIPLWKELEQQSERMCLQENHLSKLLSAKSRLSQFSLKGAGLFYDFSRQRVDEKIMKLLFELAEKRQTKEQFASMTQGAKINNTENRAALHTATRSFSQNPVFTDDENIIPEQIKIRKEIQAFSEQIHNGNITCSNGKVFKHVVVIGIGGSYLGTEFVATALNAFANKNIGLFFLANVDVHNFGEIVSVIDPESTLWIVISKSYTTAETKANTNQVCDFLKEKGIDPLKHIVTVTAKGSPGDTPPDTEGAFLKTFHMFDYIGGRYSVTSAVGGVPLSLYLGFDKYERFLKGAEEMDIHAQEAPAEKNLPLIAALIGIWNNNFLGYPAQGIIPYASPLRKLAPHVQQLYMESNGKSVTRDNEFIDEETGTIIFGEPGTNAQHSFFQLAHQGRAFPIDFIGVVNPQYTQYHSKSKNVTNHQELWANLIAQPAALANGMNNDDKARFFSGNRPSSTILLNDLEPENIGRLLSFYEARTVFEAFIWGINPFDQFGVELGKKLADDVRNLMSVKNDNDGQTFDNTDPISRFYLEILYSGKI